MYITCGILLLFIATGNPRNPFFMPFDLIHPATNFYLEKWSQIMHRTACKGFQFQNQCYTSIPNATATYSTAVVPIARDFAISVESTTTSRDSANLTATILLHRMQPEPTKKCLRLWLGLWLEILPGAAEH